MRYVPNLISKENKVLPEYFKGSSHKATDPKNSFQFSLMTMIAIIIFIIAVFSIFHFFLFILLGWLGFVILPAGHHILENELRFKFTTKIKSIFCSFLLLCCIPTYLYYAEVDRQEAYAKKLEEEKILKEKLEAEKKETERNAKLNFYLSSCSDLQKSHQLTDALSKLDSASLFAIKENDKKLIQEARISISSIEISDLIKANNYKTALNNIQGLISQSPLNSDLLYKRALCNSKTGKIREAVEDLKVTMQLDHEESVKLYEKINPLKKRVLYYTTRCCDGTTSSAKGRGACSHHGGVCNWNDPIYQEYRDY